MARISRECDGSVWLLADDADVRFSTEGERLEWATAYIDGRAVLELRSGLESDLPVGRVRCGAFHPDNHGICAAVAGHDHPHVGLPRAHFYGGIAIVRVRSPR